MDSTSNSRVCIVESQDDLPTVQSNDRGIYSTFGWGKYRPTCLKFLANSKWFLFIIMLYTLSAGEKIIADIFYCLLPSLIS